jgi:hypothetical protein
MPPHATERSLSVNALKKRSAEKSITPVLSPNRPSEWWWESMAHSLKQGILGLAKGISLRFSQDASRPRSSAARHSPWCGTWIPIKEAGGSHSPALRSRTKHGFEDPVGWRRRIARSGRHLVWEEMRASSGLVPCCTTDRANRKGIPVSPLWG